MIVTVNTEEIDVKEHDSLKELIAAACNCGKHWFQGGYVPRATVYINPAGTSAVFTIPEDRSSPRPELFSGCWGQQADIEALMAACINWQTDGYYLIGLKEDIETGDVVEERLMSKQKTIYFGTIRCYDCEDAILEHVELDLPITETSYEDFLRSKGWDSRILSSGLIAELCEMCKIKHEPNIEPLKIPGHPLGLREERD